VAGISTDDTGGFVFDPTYDANLLNVYIASARADGTWLEESPDELLEMMTASDMS
jgi:hypothetical protein